jgi:hypothetical protein
MYRALCKLRTEAEETVEHEACNTGQQKEKGGNPVYEYYGRPSHEGRGINLEIKWKQFSNSMHDNRGTC